MTLEETLAQIKPLDKNAMDVAAKRWDSIAKPLHSLGKMEKLVIQIAGITGNPDMKIQKRALVPINWVQNLPTIPFIPIFSQRSQTPPTSITIVRRRALINLQNGRI